MDVKIISSILITLNFVTFFVIIITAIFFIVTFAFSRGMSPKWLARYINKRIFIDPESQYPIITESLPKNKKFPLPISLIYQLILSLILGLLVTPFILLYKYPSIMAVNAGFICFIVGFFLILLSVRLHLKVNSNRKLKYELFTAGMMTIFAGMQLFSIMNPEIYTQLKDRHPADILESVGASMFGAYCSPLIFFAFFGIVLTRVTYRSGINQPSKATRFFYKIRAMYNPVPWLSLIVFYYNVMGDRDLAASYTLLLISVFLPLRYLVVERLRDNPIIYLRSFHYTESPLVLGKILLPSILWFAPLLAVTHKLQPPEEIYSKITLHEVPTLYSVSNEKWQNWIEQCFSKASVIIIDCSVQSPGVMWELDLAKTILPKDRIIVIQNMNSQTVLSSDLLSVEYELGFWKERKAVRELKHHLRKAFSSLYRIAV